MWAIIIVTCLCICNSVNSLSCYNCNSTTNGNDCSDPINKNTFTPQDCTTIARSNSIWDKWNIFSRIVDNSTILNSTEKTEMERLFWSREGTFNWDKWNLFSRLFNKSNNNQENSGDTNPLQRLFWRKFSNFDWNKWRMFSNLVETFNDSYATEAKDMENFSLFKSKSYQCVTVEKTYSGSKTTERYCQVKSQFVNHCSKLSSQAGSSGYTLTKCLLCEYDGCNSSISYTLSLTLLILAIVSLNIC